MYIRRLPLMLLCLVLLSGCASIGVNTVSMSGYVTQRRSDVLTTGEFSAVAKEVLLKVGTTVEDCAAAPGLCRQKLLDVEGIAGDQQLSALAEIALYEAIATAKNADKLRAIEAWLEAVRYAYAYLFYGEKRLGERVLEDRQIQVRDYYNFSVQQAIALLFDTGGQDHKTLKNSGSRTVGAWTVSLRLPEESAATQPPVSIIPASSLSFSGLRSMYRRDGFGAELVAVMPGAKQALSKHGQGNSDGKPQVFQEMPFPVVTVTMAVKGDSLAQVLASREVVIGIFDPYRSHALKIQDLNVTLSANFTAGYGLWLTQSDFSGQSLRTLLGMDNGIVRPTIYLMQPYDPKRRVIIMLHGLASSPEAWVNLANEVMGDENLRRHYQIWQVYYPTNLPIVVNHLMIRQAIEATFNHFDPGKTAVASRDVTLIGHSMGGVLARLMVSSLKNVAWEALLDQEEFSQKQKDILRDDLKPYFDFEALSSVNRVIFIAAPHRGAPFAAGGLGRFAAGLVSLPLAAIDRLGKTVARLQSPGAQKDAVPAVVVPNSIDNLSDKGRFVHLFGDIPIAQGVTYNSIIARENKNIPLLQSDDGVVPYVSSHLQGAESELIVNSSHSVQENPEAILEIRRILGLSASSD